MIWDFLREFEAGEFSSWLREGNIVTDPFSTFYILLGFHSIGMAAVVGICWMMSSRIFGFQQKILMAKSQELMRLAWWGFYLNLISGALLLLAQPRREMITGLFWVKMISIIMALLTMRVMEKGLANIRSVPDPQHPGAVVETVPLKMRTLALGMSLFWLVAIICGRLVGYTQPPPPF